MLEKFENKRSGDCVLHGEDIVYLYSDICKGYVCSECVKSNLYFEDIKKEVMELHQEIFKPVS